MVQLTRGEDVDRPENDPDAGLDGVLAWNFVRVARFVGNRMARRLEGHGLNPINFGVLAFLADAPEMSTSDIARAVFVRPQSMSPLLDGLEQRGLVRRTGSRSRGRRNPVQITEAGCQALAGVWEVARATNDLSDAGLTTTESKQLNQLLLKVVRATSADPHRDHEDAEGQATRSRPQPWRR